MTKITHNNFSPKTSDRDEVPSAAKQKEAAAKDRTPVREKERKDELLPVNGTDENVIRKVEWRFV